MSKIRPDIWVGHASLETADLKASHEFLLQIGLTPVFHNDEIAIVELRGGTHLIMSQVDAAKGIDAPFDFMVEDLDKTYARFESMELDVSEIERGKIHDHFILTEPGGNRITVNSTHVEDHSIV